MALNLRSILEGLRIVPRSSTTIDLQGELEVLSSNGKLQYHNGTSVSPVVTAAHSETLTNKTIDADLNTLSNIDNADIKSGAAIDRAKLASGTADHVIINNGSGVLSSEATLAKSRGGSGQDNSSLTFPASGTLATLAGTESFSNKKFTDSIQLEDPGAGTNKVTIQAPTLAGDYTLTLPVDDGSTDQVLKTNGSGVLSWVTALTDPMTTAGDLIYRNGSNATDRLPVGTEGQVLTVVSGAPAWAAASGGGGGGGSGVDGAIRNLDEDEISGLVVDGPNQFLDDFNTDKGTKSNLAISASALRFSGSNLTGTYERTREFSPSLGSVVGAIVYDGQQLAPKNTALSPSNTSTAVTMIVSGNVVNMFADTKTVIIAKRLSDIETGSDDKTTIRALMTSTNVVALLELDAAPSYNSGTDETTLVIANPDALDLSMGVSSGDFNDNLRIIPFDQQLQVKSKTAGSYETMDIDDLYARQEVVIPGENFFSELFSITGSILHHSAQKSPSGQYQTVKLLEKTAGNSFWHFGYSVDYGKTFTKYSTTVDFGEALAEEKDGEFERFNKDTMAVSDDGKAFFAYQTSSSFYILVKGFYSDLTIGTPVLTDTPSMSTDSANSSGASGVIFSLVGSASFSGLTVKADTADLSYIAVASVTGGNVAYVRWYSAQGATHIGLSSTSYTQTNPDPFLLFVNGSGSSHRTTMFNHRNDNGHIQQVYWDQGSTTAVSNTTIYANNDTMIAGGALDDKIYIFTRNDSDSSLYLLRGSDIGFGLTPSWSTRVQVLSSGVTPDLFNGWNSSSSRRLFKTLYSRIAINPSDENHIAIAYDATHPDSVIRSTLVEVRDTTAYQGIWSSQYNVTSYLTVGYLTSQVTTAQTFTMGTNRVRTVAFRVNQVGFIPSGYALNCTINTTSAGVPTSTVVATATNSYDPSLISKGDPSNQWVYFNFDSPSLTNGTVYALVLSGTFPISSSNHLRVTWYSGSSGAYIGDNTNTYTSPTGSLAYEINAEWIKDTGKAIQSGANRAAFGFHDQESQIAKIDSSTALLSFRRVSSSSDVMRQLSGYPFRRVLTWGSGGTQSALTSSIVAGYSTSNFDEYMVFNTSCGATENQRQNTSTGVLDSNSSAEDRSGMVCATASYTNITSADTVSDASFQSGQCIDFNGSDEVITYDTRVEHQYYYNKPFAVEFECKPTSIGGGFQCITGNYRSTATIGGLILGVLNNGGVSLAIENSSGATIASTDTVASVLVNGQYNVVRISYDGSGGQIRIYTATSYNGTFTEASYASTTNFTTGNSSTNSVWRIGSRDGSNFFNGRVGYVKFINGSSTFAYAGYRDQAPLVGHLNLGTRILAENKVGQNATASGTNFDNIGIISGDVSQASMVDSNRLILTFNHTIDNANKGNVAYFKLNANRVSTRDVSSFQGLVFNFNK